MPMLDLTTLVNSDTKIISGKDRGINARLHHKLDEFDSSDEAVTVVMPDHVKVITPSFVLGMFSKSVRSFGSADKFFEHYQFKTSPLVLSQLMQGAVLSLVEGNALSD